MLGLADLEDLNDLEGGPQAPLSGVSGIPSAVDPVVNRLGVLYPSEVADETRAEDFLKLLDDAADLKSDGSFVSVREVDVGGLRHGGGYPLTGIAVLVVHISALTLFTMFLSVQATSS